MILRMRQMILIGRGRLLGSRMDTVVGRVARLVGVLLATIFSLADINPCGLLLKMEYLYARNTTN